MRHLKTILVIVVLIVGAWAAMRWSAEDNNVRGQDPNVETRALNTSGLPEGTSGTAWSGDEAFVSRALAAHARLAGAHEGPRAEEHRREHEAARQELEALAQRRQWTTDTREAEPLSQAETVSDHAQALAIFTLAETQASDAELRAWAARSAAMLRSHE